MAIQTGFILLMWSDMYQQKGQYWSMFETETKPINGMVLNYLLPGLLAALMAVPGTGQKEIATVGEEPVVKEVKVEQAGAIEQPQQPLYWYSVDNNNRTVGSHIGVVGTKDEIIESQGCKDLSSEMCLFGSTNPSLPIGTDASGAAPQNRINKS